MTYDPERHHRRSIRLSGYDYRWAGIYFITVCTGGRKCIFGKISDGEMNLSQRGLVAKQCWLDLPNHHANVELDEFVIMPNHIHAVLGLSEERATHASPLQETTPVGATPASPSFPPRGPAAGSLATVIGSFRSAVTRNINLLRPNSGNGTWQPNYFEHVVGNDHALDQIREYIITDPQRWQDDAENVAGTGGDRFEDFARALARERLPRKRATQASPLREGT